MVKRAVIFTNGDLARLPQLAIRRSDYLIGVDGGTRLILRLKRRPDLIIGDLDSLPRFPRGVPVIKYPQEKDFTDTELALEFCAKQKFKEVVMVGALGSRLDHLITNIFLGSRFNLTIIEAKQTLYFVTTRIILAGKPGDLVSLIPLLGDCRGVSATGLKWRLQGETLKFGFGRGISNVMLGKRAGVRLKRGRLLVVYNRL